MKKVENQVEYKATIKKIYQYDFPDADGGVMVYEVSSDELPLSTFFIVSLDDTSTELAWGVGDTPQAALRAAEEEWNTLYHDTPMQEKNPFLHVIKQLYS